MEREEKKKSHVFGASFPFGNPQVSPTALSPQKSSTVASAPAEKVGGATLTRLKPEDKERLVDEDRALYVGFPRGEKSTGAATALEQALLVRLRKLQIPVESASPASSKFVTAVFFDHKGRDKALRRLEAFNFVYNGRIVRPDIARYGATKPQPKITTYQIP